MLLLLLSLFPRNIIASLDVDTGCFVLSVVVVVVVGAVVTEILLVVLGIFVNIFDDVFDVTLDTMLLMGTVREFVVDAESKLE